MRRLPSLFTMGALALLMVGALFFGLFRQQQAVADAALPPGHPPVPDQAGASWLDWLAANDVFLPFLRGGGDPPRVATTANDFYLPGTQPGMLEDEITDPYDALAGCGRGCHLGYNPPDPTMETMFTWQGSMMAQSARDPVFYAALDVANADAAGVGEFCVRCHTPRAWLNGRGASDGSELVGADYDGVQCEVCHRLVDPVYTAENPARDVEVLAALPDVPTVFGSGAIVVDPLDERRGPFDLQEDWQNNPHSILGLDWPWQSPFHTDSALCGSCHDITNPVFSWDEESQSYAPNVLDTPGDVTEGFPIERTYSEWRLSAYNTPQGVYAPQFGGNEPYVSSCQDCHMRKVTGAGGSFFGNTVVRDNMPLHDLTGANTWVPQTLPLHPEFGDDFTPGELEALDAGIERARTMLQNAATLTVQRQGSQLTVTVTNETGHKLPTGYPEGRRIWLQLLGYDADGNLVYASGQYDADTAELTYDADLKIYETKQGLTESWAAQLGLPAGASFHFALNNMVVTDNRIPPRGYNFAGFLAAGAAPVSDGVADPTLYADGQYWDTTVYHLPANVVSGVVRLLYQTASKEYIEFLRDNNPQPNQPNNRGQILYNLWQQTGRSQPEVMIEAAFGP